MTDILVLCYHAVSPTWQAPLSVTPASLEAQLSELVARRWRATTFTDAVLRRPYPRTLAVTFDDAFLSVLTQAEPILGRLGIPATVFAPTAFMSERQRLRWAGIDQWLETPFAGELECMCWDDLRRLSGSGWEIGSHTCTHPRLTRLDEKAIHSELEASRLECERQLGVPCTSIAYPYGEVNARVADAAEKAAYRAAARLSSGLAPDGPLRWPRVGIYHGDQRWRFNAKVNGTLRWLRTTRLWPSR